jgi:hypothetical protein
MRKFIYYSLNFDPAEELPALSDISKKKKFVLNSYLGLEVIHLFAPQTRRRNELTFSV